MSQHKLIKVPCPICNSQKKFLDVDIPDNDPHITSYGDIYASLTKSFWKICGSCGFVHQNPRPSIQTLNEYYLQAKYHRNPAKPSVEVLKSEYKGAYAPDISFTLEHLKDKLPKGAKILDVGCGFGFALYELKKLGFDVYGIEPDENRARFAREKLGLNNIKVGTMNDKVDFDQKFDLIYNHHAFEHVADFEEVFTAIKKVIKPDSYFFSSVPTYRENRSIVSKLYLNAGHYSSFSYKSFARLLAKNGFQYIAHKYYNGIGIRLTDDLLIVAKNVGDQKIDTTQFQEDPLEVETYINHTNPKRALLYSPLYSMFTKRVLIQTRRIWMWKRFLTDFDALKDKLQEKRLLRK